MKTLHSKILELLPSSIEEPIIEPDTLLVSYHDTEKAKKVTIKLGRLLTKKTSLSELEVKNLVEFQRRHLKGELLMKLTQDADEIVSIYEYWVAPNGGTKSCMYRESCVRVYSYDPNLFLASFYDGEEANEDTFVGRTLVRTDSMEYIRTYATHSKYHDNILLTLENAGYSQGDLVGIKLGKEENPYGSGHLMPYLDGGEQYLTDYGSFFQVVGYPTSLVANTTNGIIEAGCRCARCEDFVPEEEVIYTEYDGDICENCYETYYVSFEGEIYLRCACSEVIGGEYDRELVPDEMLSDLNYFIPDDASHYYHIDLLCSCSGGLYLAENCVELVEEDDGYNYALEADCTELEEFEVSALENWEDYFVLGWYTDERYKEIINVELPRLLELQEIRLEEERTLQEQQELEAAGQTNLFSLIGEAA
jgi:hypothetical protein